MNYYNEFDPKTAAWLRELIAQKLIPAGEVDTRSITDVQPSDLSGFTQCHFFAGIGGWSLALQLAGWPEDKPVWTGSCPCQPFSAAGQQKGEADSRHLYPVFSNLICERKPPVVFGEQVASKLGREWLARVRASLEEMGYAVGAADLCAPCVGAPHIRQRLFWVADSANDGWAPNERESRRGKIKGPGNSAECCGACGLADSRHQQARRGTGSSQEEGRRSFCKPAGCSTLGRLGDSCGEGLEERRDCERGAANLQCQAAQRAGAWSSYDILPCLDGKASRVESGTFPLAHGVPGRVGLLRGYGNAIVPPLGAEFIKAFMSI